MPTPAESNGISDEQVIEAHRAGDAGAFASLVRRYRQELFHFLVRFLGDRAAAEDVFQDSFLQVYQSLDTFDTKRRFKPWLFTIAANKGRDFLRKRARRSAAPLSAPVHEHEDAQPFVDLMEANLPQPDDALSEQEQRERIRRVVEQLPDHLREILLLAYFQQFSYNEIAEVLGIPLGTVKSRLHTAVGTFAENWRRMNPNPE